MTQYLLDTLLWTGALIALVLLLRRPVARHLGAQAAYALWALPLLRLAIPPITLPAWLKPAEPAPPLAEMAAADPAPVLAMQSLAHGGEIVPVSPLPAAASVPPVDWLTPLLVLWLAGAAIFLIRRLALYFAMRRELLARARPVGEVGRVRLVETAATLGPVAFGVFDKVVALPQGFMVQRDRRKRDLAIAHELAHHRGRDLLANVAVQPLFALHWFNPLGWVGWTALRRDQEAACDTRVVAERSRDERAAYAAIIAGFATTAGAAPRLALAAPMACPVLGDKSIIHRLRSLTMADISPRRRFAGRALLAGAALALPLTASISYAETRASEVPAPEVPAAPAAPQAPIAPPVADAPAVPPARPVPPAPPVEADMNIDLTIERHRDLLRRGAVLVDDRDTGTRPRVLFYLEHALR
ncbi:MAG: M56 family metallopeptidase, partial [Alphaproteobacteria bacterium]|nr:M56 family metallopeptidase [Alphaproteobacteria bacterium]